MIKAVLFDMDGVLVDSEELIFQAARQMFSEHGIDVSRSDFQPYIGTGENSYLGNVAKKYDLSIDLEKDKKRTYEIYEQLAEKKLNLLPGVHDFVNRCKEKGLKMAIATSADEFKMIVNLRVAKLDNGIFDATVNGLEVTHKKPHPEIYIKAAQKLKLKPAECIVIEDAVNGIESAKSAGCKCIALTTSFPESKLTGADWIFKDLSYISDVVFEDL